jgi:tetratricopeptide (TPR) repeat protein
VSAKARTSSTSRRFLEIAEAIPWNGLGVGEDFIDEEPHHWPSPADLTAWRQALATEWPEDETAAYLYLSLNCEFRPPSPVDLTPVKDRYPASPLIQYRWASCASSGETMLGGLLKADSRFQEIQYLLARHDLNSRRIPEGADRSFQAWQAIPRFTAAGLLVADFALTDEEYGRALEFAEGVLAVVPTHRRAMLDRLRALSYLERHQNAAAIARQLIALGNWYLGGAYYWLSWNEYHLNDIVPAITHVQTAKQYETSVRICMLAGLLRVRQERWAEARQEFLAALTLDGDACDAQFYLGHIGGAVSAWKEAGGYFERAVGCYASTERSLEQEIAAASRQPTVDARAARRLTKWRKDLAAATDQRHVSVYNTAVNFLAAGMSEQARRYAKQAANIPPYADRAKALLAMIDRAK